MDFVVWISQAVTRIDSQDGTWLLSSRRIPFSPLSMTNQRVRRICKVDASPTRCLATINAMLQQYPQRGTQNRAVVCAACLPS
ncbi:hypothetical protein AC1031_022001 [Aphanomyces cochlioides]|nr:hypothetical protein AC1031_022001 [Aphanomyces cochlioides]